MQRKIGASARRLPQELLCRGPDRQEAGVAGDAERRHLAMTIQVVQSRAGVPIRLTHERWQHIITRHPALRSRQARVLETVADPDLQQVGDAGELLAVRAYGDMPPRWRYLVVVYAELSPHDGFIITAYPARRPPPHGRILWTRP